MTGQTAALCILLWGMGWFVVVGVAVARRVLPRSAEWDRWMEELDARPSRPMWRRPYTYVLVASVAFGGAVVAPQSGAPAGIVSAFCLVTLYIGVSSLVWIRRFDRRVGAPRA